MEFVQYFFDFIVYANFILFSALIWWSFADCYCVYICIFNLLNVVDTVFFIYLFIICVCLEIIA